MTSREEWSSWTSWRGSPRFVKHIAEATVAAVGGEPDLCITASVLDDKETFHTASAFVDEVTPEALRDFDRLDVVVRNAQLCVEIVFTRRVRGLKGSSGDSSVKLSVRWERPDAAKLAAKVARVSCAALRRGHRRWLGRTDGSDGIPVGWRGSSLPRPDAVLFLAKALGGFALSLLVLSTISVLVPETTLPRGIAMIVGLGAGFGSAFVLPTLVPSIEIADPGTTRLARVARWTSGTVVSLILAQIAGRIFD